jgi:hypothetical protein
MLVGGVQGGTCGTIAGLCHGVVLDIFMTSTSAGGFSIGTLLLLHTVLAVIFGVAGATAGVVLGVVLGSLAGRVAQATFTRLSVISATALGSVMAAMTLGLGSITQVVSVGFCAVLSGVAGHRYGLAFADRCRDGSLQQDAELRDESADGDGDGGRGGDSQ